MTVWLAAILVAVWTMGEAAVSGEPGPAIVLLAWVGAALFGLVSAARSLRALVLGERPKPRLHRNHGWNDGLAPPLPAAADQPHPPPADASPLPPGRTS